MRHNQAQSLMQVLDAEKDALIKGNLHELADLAEKKQALETALQAEVFSENQVRQIATKAAENERLYLAAIRGVKTARTRLNDMADVRSGLSLYTKDGAKMRVPRGGKSLEKKA